MDIQGRSTLEGEYRTSRRNPEKFTYRRKVIYEIEQLLDVHLEAVESTRGRLKVADLETVLARLREMTGADPIVVALDNEDRKALVEQGLDEGGDF